MIGRIFLSLNLCLWLSLLGACANAEGQAEELYSIAQLEERQFNSAHAAKIYEELIEKYPHTSWANKASQRLDAIDQENPSQN